MKPDSFAIARIIQKKNKGGMVGGNRSEIIKNIIAKKMNCGGMVKKYSKGGNVESEESSKEDWYDADFLSDEEDAETENHTYPDPDGVESTEGMGKMGMMAILLERIRKKHKGL